MDFNHFNQFAGLIRKKKITDPVVIESQDYEIYYLTSIFTFSREKVKIFSTNLDNFNTLKNTILAVLSKVKEFKIISLDNKDLNFSHENLKLIKAKKNDEAFDFKDFLISDNMSKIGNSWSSKINHVYFYNPSMYNLHETKFDIYWDHLSKAK